VNTRVIGSDGGIYGGNGEPAESASIYINDSKGGFVPSPADTGRLREKKTGKYGFLKQARCGILSGKKTRGRGAER
jgi:hypothetical protein